MAWRGDAVENRALGQRTRAARGKSRYKGVCLHKASSKFLARISIDGERRNLGYFEDEVEAARAYDRALHSSGRTGVGNFPLSDYPDLLAERERRDQRLLGRPLRMSLVLTPRKLRSFA